MHLLNARQRQPVQCWMNHRSQTSHWLWLCKNRRISSHETGTPWILCRWKYALGSEGRQDILNPDPLVLWHSVPDLPTPCMCIVYPVSRWKAHKRVHSPFDVGRAGAAAGKPMMIRREETYSRFCFFLIVTMSYIAQCNWNHSEAIYFLLFLGRVEWETEQCLGFIVFPQCIPSLTPLPDLVSLLSIFGQLPLPLIISTHSVSNSIPSPRHQDYLNLIVPLASNLKAFVQIYWDLCL